MSNPQDQYVKVEIVKVQEYRTFVQQKLILYFWAASLAQECKGTEKDIWKIHAVEKNCIKGTGAGEYHPPKKSMEEAKCATMITLSVL